MRQEETVLFADVESFLQEAEKIYEESRFWELESWLDKTSNLSIKLPDPRINIETAHRSSGGELSFLMIISVVCEQLSFVLKKKIEYIQRKRPVNKLPAEEKRVALALFSLILRLDVLKDKVEESNKAQPNNSYVAFGLKKDSRLVKSENLKIIVEFNESLRFALGYR